MTYPGIKRDGTRFSNRAWIDGQWVRYRGGLPRKINGYKRISQPTSIVRGVSIFPSFPNFALYVGTYQTLSWQYIDSTGNPLSGSGGLITPTTFRSDVNNSWSFDKIYSATDNGSVILAHAAPNLSDINSDIETDIYYGDLFSTSTLTPTGQTASGGIVSLAPYLFMFGNDGYIQWSAANDPTTILQSARPTASKIVAGFQTRGGQNSPAGLFWSLDSLLRCTQVGTSDIEFSFDVVSSDISILSSKSIVEVDGVFFWVGVNRFFMYNGVVREWENDYNRDYFFNNLNRAQSQKVWATRVSAYDEIWIHYPSGDSTECNEAIIFNVRENKWYDTSVSRSCGDFDPTFASPIWCGNTANENANYDIWVHETGVDQNKEGALSAIDSYITSSDISNVAFGPSGQLDGTEKSVCLRSVELDLIQSGDMTLTTYARQYVRDSSPTTNAYTFSDDDLKVDVRDAEGMEISLKLRSNIVGGYFELGQTMLEIAQGSGRT